MGPITIDRRPLQKAVISSHTWMYKVTGRTRHPNGAQNEAPRGLGGGILNGD